MELRYQPPHTAVFRTEEVSWNLRSLWQPYCGKRGWKAGIWPRSCLASVCPCAAPLPRLINLCPQLQLPVPGLILSSASSLSLKVSVLLMY